MEDQWIFLNKSHIKSQLQVKSGSHCIKMPCMTRERHRGGPPPQKCIYLNHVTADDMGDPSKIPLTHIPSSRHLDHSLAITGDTTPHPMSPPACRSFSPPLFPQLPRPIQHPVLPCGVHTHTFHLPPQLTGSLNFSTRSCAKPDQDIPSTLLSRSSDPQLLEISN